MRKITTWTTAALMLALSIGFIGTMAAEAG